LPPSGCGGLETILVRYFLGFIGGFLMMIKKKGYMLRRFDLEISKTT
jgi:hypothetical protein